MAQSTSPIPPFNLAMAGSKARFMSSPDNISKHRALVDSREFQRGVDFALLEYQDQLMDGVGDGNTAATVGFKLRGVHEFLRVFRLLSEPTRQLTTLAASDNLVEPPPLK